MYEKILIITNNKIGVECFLLAFCQNKPMFFVYLHLTKTCSIKFLSFSFTLKRCILGVYVMPEFYLSLPAI